MYKFDRITKTLLILLVVGVWGLLLQSAVGIFPSAEAQSKTIDEKAAAVSPVIRTRGLIIVDEQGRERVIMGAPVPDPPHRGKRVSAAAGMIILDPQGYERFGVGIMDNGQMGMGFDAPPVAGDPERSTERIHIVADPKGGAYLRFTNRQTGVAGLLRLGEDDKLYLDLLDVQKDNNKIIRRKISVDGDARSEAPFKK
ncbi:MAG: hypothetical protein ACK4S4_05875 [Pyrinomonadaceae bacterium]